MLQFRAKSRDEIRDAGCKIDCWLIPRVNGIHGVTLRYALYRFLVQGFRRCQSYWPVINPTPIGGLVEQNREFFSGRPLWKVGDSNHPRHPGGFYRSVNVKYGAFYWTHDDPSLVDGWVWDTQPLWSLPTAQDVRERSEIGHGDEDLVTEDIYN